MTGSPAVLARTHPAISAAAARLALGEAVDLGGLWGASSALALAALLPGAPGAVLALAPGEDAAGDLEDALRAFGERPLRFHASEEALGRLSVLDALATGKALVVASSAALEARVPSPERLREATLRLQAGQELDPEDLIRTLCAAGLSRSDTADLPGELARRGGIVDVFPPGGTRPVRIEWKGARIRSLRPFDPESQRSGPEMPGASLLLPGPGEGDGGLLDHLPASAWAVLADPALLREKADPALLSRLLAGRARLSLAPLPAPPPAVNVHVETAERPRNEPGWTTAVALEEGELPFPALRLPGRIAEGFSWPDLRLQVLDGARLLKRPPPRTDPPPSRPLESFLDLRRGDTVVHLVHGIARFRGLKVLHGPSGPRGEFLVLEYREGALVYVPVEQVDLVQKYVGAGSARPRLAKIGERRWALAKAQAQRATEDLAQELLRIQAVRATRLRPPCPRDAPLLAEFEAGFPFDLTRDQARALGEIRGDLEGPHPMDRLLCGDVGYGKTELAMRAAFQCVAAGRQAAVLVPTTVLAQQHQETFSLRMAPYAVRVESLSRFKPRAEQGRILKALAAGEVDVVVGTHRLIQKDVAFRDLGLLVVDEEQRFGVGHKQALKRLRETVDVLTMTATPIPRTLHTALLGIRAISNLNTSPLGRQAVRTTVCPFSEALIAEAVRREMARGGQAFVVHNRVHSIRAFEALVRRAVPEARVLVGHGQMPPGELERVMHGFVAGRADVLLCTTIIESGLDIPSANTLVVHEAHRFGLADLHQLRGRVGRSERLACAYLFLPEKGRVRGTAAKRLKAIEEFCELGAGFPIALRDLEIRGAGNLLGPEQSGHIAAVGYEMYCRLLERAARRLRGEASAEDRPEAVLELGVEAFLPETYVPDPRHRMEQYRLLARAGSPEAVAEVEAGWTDRFGPPPAAAARLLVRHRLRLALPAFTVTLARGVPEGVLVRFGIFERARPFLEGIGGAIRVQEPGEVIVAGAWGPEEALERLVRASGSG